MLLEELRGRVAETLDLVSVGGFEERLAGRIVPVERPDADAGRPRDAFEGGVRVLREREHGRGKDFVLVPLRVAAQPRLRSRCFLFLTGHHDAPEAGPLPGTLAIGGSSGYISRNWRCLRIGHSAFRGDSAMEIAPLATWELMNEVHQPAAPCIAQTVSPHPLHGPRRVAGVVNIVSIARLCDS